MAWKNRFELEKSRLNLISQIFMSIRDIKLYDKYNYFFRNFRNIEIKYFKMVKMIMTLLFLPRLLLEYFFILLISLLIIFALNSTESLINMVPLFAFLVVASTRLAPIIKD